MGPTIMENLRFQAVEKASEKRPVEVITPTDRPSEYFGKKVFNRAKMYKYLSREVYDKLIDVIDNGAELDRSIADEIAKGMSSGPTRMVSPTIPTGSSPHRGHCRSTTLSSSTTARAA